MNYLSTEADGGLGYLDSETSGGSPGGGGGATDVTAAVAGDFLARIKEAADAGYRLSIGLASDGQPVLVLGSGAAIDSRIKRTAAKTITVDDGAGGAVTLNVIGTVQQGGAALLTRTAGDAVYASLGSGFTDPTALTGDMIYRPVTTGVDKAAGKSVISSSSGDRYIGPRLTDGDDTNFVYGGNDVGAENAILDLTAAQTIASWRAVFGNTDANGLTLSYSTDGITFTAIDSTLASGTVRVFAAPTTARYWQLSRVGGATYLGLATLNLYAPSATTLVRLPVGSAGQVLGIATGVPAWVTPRGMCLGAAGYRPVSDTTVLTTTNATGLDDIDASLAVTFTPLGTKALARVTLMQENASTGGNSYVGVKNGSTVVGKNLIAVNAANNYVGVTVALLVTGLTPGTPLTWKPGVGVSDASHGMLVLAGPTFGQVVMEVWDVP